MDLLDNYINGKISKEKFIECLKTLLKAKKEKTSILNEAAYIYLEKISKEIGELEYIDDKSEKLKLFALICDIYNGFAHALAENAKKGKYIDNQAREFFGLKKYMIQRIIKQCKIEKNKAYGLVENQPENIFVVDIATVGQIKWHIPRNVTLCCKKYDFEISEKDKISNSDLIRGVIKKEEYEVMSNHNKIVIDSFDTEEMIRCLYPIDPFKATLESGVKGDNEYTYSGGGNGKSNVKEKEVKEK